MTTPPIADEALIERLRKRRLVRITRTEGVVDELINPDGPEAADYIEALATRSSADEGVVEAVSLAIWREDHYDPRLCSHGGDGGDMCAYCEPHDDDTPAEWPADKERAERQARAAIAAMSDRLGKE